MSMSWSKVFNRLTFRCAGALLAGAVVVSLASGMLSLYGENHEQVKLVQTHQSLQFPENEKMLDAVSAQLAREGAALSNIAPAAGDATPKN